MKLIPDILLRCNSSAEARVFEILKSIDLGPHWTAYHSLNCSEHAYKHWSEIDFLLLGPDAALVLEVKGGRVQRRQGLWIHTDRYGRCHTKSEGPFEQARSAMYALKDLLADRYHIDAVARDRMSFGFGVVLPDIDWDLDTPETPRTLVADRLAFATTNGFARYLRHLISYWTAKNNHACRVDESELRQLRQRIRPDVDLYPPLSLRVGTILAQMQNLTDEQYERLEIIEQNPRVLISGGAGTGKTFLLVQCARRERASGRKPLVVVESPLLAAHIRRLEPDPGIEVVPFSRLGSRRAKPADVLLVDEGQDLLQFDVVAQLSGHLEGGVDRGCWRWFMDENNQAGIAGAFDPEVLEYLQRGLAGGPATRVSLRRNCRNTREIVQQVQLWTGADIGKTEVTGHGGRPQVVKVAATDLLPGAIDDVINKLLGEGLRGGDIGIVVPPGNDGEVLRALAAPLRRRIVPLDTTTVGADLSEKIVWASADRFKGLERPVVLLVGFDEQTLNGNGPAFYVATTRGNFGLWIFAGPAFAARLTEAEDGHRRGIH